jgi:hypothetical protein
MTIIISREQDFGEMIHLIHTKIPLYGVKPSKVALPSSKRLQKVKVQMGNWGVASNGVCWERRLSISIYTSEKGGCRAHASKIPHATILGALTAPRDQRWGREVARVVRVHQGCGHTLAGPTGHRLHVAGCWLCLGHSLGAFMPKMSW